MNQREYDRTVLKAEQEAELFRAYKSGNKEAGDKIILAHRPLAASLARKALYGSHDLEDLLQEATIGLMLALQRYELGHQVRFNTYARWWIKAALTTYTQKNHSIITLPSSPDQRRLYYKLRKAKSRLGIYSDGNLSNDEIERLVEDLGASPDDIITMNCILAPGYVSSADAPLSPGSDAARIDQLADPASDVDKLIERIDNERLAAKAREALASLKPRQREAVERRVFRGELLREAGDAMGITREGVRQLENKGLKVLRRAIEDAVAELA